MFLHPQTLTTSYAYAETMAFISGRDEYLHGEKAFLVDRQISTREGHVVHTSGDLRKRPEEVLQRDWVLGDVPQSESVLIVLGSDHLLAFGRVPHRQESPVRSAIDFTLDEKAHDGRHLQCLSRAELNARTSCCCGCMKTRAC